MIGRFSFAMLSILLIIIGHKMTVSAFKCAECASPELRDHWQLTSYPQILSDDKFISDCDSQADTIPDNKLVDCTSLCVEMIIPTDDRYVMLRGCLQNFLTGYRSNGSLVGSNAKPIGDCSYGPTERKVGIRNAEGDVIATDTGYVGIHFCESAEGRTAAMDMCNIAMSLKSMIGMYRSDPPKKAAGFFDGLSVRDGGAVPCPAASTSTVTCINCLSIDDNGACDKHTTTTCSGEYCSKIYGKTGLTKFVKRGCSPVNPFGFKTDGCTRLNLKDNTLLGDGTAGVAPRMRRAADLSLDYQADQCYCTTDKCNGAASLTFAFISFLSPILIAVRLW